MSTDRNTLFLKLALKNEFLQPDQADQIMSAIESRAALGIDKAAGEVAVEKGFLKQSQVDSLEDALRAMLPPDKIAGFEVLEEIGRGAAGTVYRARQLSLDKIVALKVMHPNLKKNPIFIEQFMREAKAVGKISHPHVVHAIDAGESEGYYYLAMELIDGESVKEKVERDGPFDETALLDLGRCAAQGLASAHGHGLLHRDMKPDNILLGSDGHIKIADLGLAMPTDDAELMSREHKRMGTPFYLSPEQARGEAVSEASEMYSLGATLYFAATGKPLFTGKTVKEILTKQVHQRPAPPRQAGAVISEATENLILKLLEKDPKDRFASAQDFVQAVNELEKQLAGPSPTGRASGSAPRSRKPKAGRRPTVGGGPARPAAAPARPAVSSGSAKPAIGNRPVPAARPAAAATKSAPAGSDRVLGVSAERRAYRTRRRSVGTISGVVVGLLVSMIFILVALKKNKTVDPVTAQKQEQQIEYAKDANIVRVRREDWAKKHAVDVANVSVELDKMSANADDDRMRLIALWEYLQANADNDAAPIAIARIDQIRSSREAEKLEGIQSYLDQASSLRAEGKLMAALDMIDRIPQRLIREANMQDEIRAKFREISDQIDTEYAGDSERLRELKSKKDYAAAITLLEKIIAYADETRVRDAKLQLEEVKKSKETLARTEQERRRQEETAKYTSLLAEYKQLANDRKFKECISKAVDLDAEAVDTTVKAHLESDLLAFQLLDQFMKDALQYLDDIKDDDKILKLEFRDDTKRQGTSGGFERKGDVIYLLLEVQDGRATTKIDITELNDATIFGWAEAKLGPRNPAYIVPIGVLFAYRGRFDLAERHFALAKERGIEPAQWIEKMEWLKKNSG